MFAIAVAKILQIHPYTDKASSVALEIEIMQVANEIQWRLNSMYNIQTNE